MGHGLNPDTRMAIRYGVCFYWNTCACTHLIFWELSLLPNSAYRHYNTCWCQSTEQGKPPYYKACWTSWHSQHMKLPHCKACGCHSTCSMWSCSLLHLCAFTPEWLNGYCSQSPWIKRPFLCLEKSIPFLILYSNLMIHNLMVISGFEKYIE